MKASAIILLLYLLITIHTANSIIIRHDVADERYIKFAEELPVTSAIVLYNSSDVAGTLITSQWVLSAAHVAETIPDGHTLLVGGDSVGIETIVIHPDWEENSRPDLALIKLDRIIKNVEPVELYRRPDEVGVEIIVAGIGDYGTGKTGVEGNPGTMRAATNLVDGTTQDNHFLYWEFDSPDSEKVTPLEGISGPGDSSGPAFILSGDTYYVAGISAGQSTQATGGVEGLYGVTEYYTRVSTFAAWIDQNISDR